MQGTGKPFSRDLWPAERERQSFIARAEFHDLLAWWDSGATEPAVVQGMAGSGKTIVLRMFAGEVARRLGRSDGVQVHNLELLSLRLTRGRDADDMVGELPSSGRGLILLDSTDTAPTDQVVELVERIRALQPRVAVALATRGRTEPWPRRWRHVVVGPLTEEESLRLVEARVGRAGLDPADAEQLRRLVGAAEGSPRTLLWLGNQALLTSVDRALGMLQERRVEAVFPFETPHTGQDLFPGGVTAAERELDIRVGAVSDALIKRLAAEPQLMYELRPRQFEELMAELFDRQGFEVELTKQTRDGGVDLYLVHHTPAGRRLTLVDAKRNAPGRPVRVGVVRQLYGVVEAKRASAGLEG